jgi:hypothetical protein
VPGSKKGERRGGRKKGTPNKLTGELKEMILQALENKGGVSYLEVCAAEHPAAFLTLVGKVLPLQVTGKEGAPLIPPGAGFQFVVQQIPGSENRT